MKQISLGLLAARQEAAAVRPEIDRLEILSVSDTMAQLLVEAAPGGAMVHLHVSRQATPPVAADLVAGIGADWSWSFMVSSLPSGMPGPFGLLPATAYHLHTLADLAGSRSPIVSLAFSTAAMDTAAPGLSDGQAIVLDETSVDLEVTTDEADGMLHAVVTATQGAPSVAQIALGQDSAGTPAAFANAQAVSEAGVQTVSATGLSQVPLYAYFVHEDASGNVSVPFEIGPFTPADVTAPVVSSVEMIVTSPTTATVTFNTDTGEGTAHVLVLVSTDPAPSAASVVAGAQASVTVGAGGPQSADITDLTPETSYLAYVVHRDAAGNDSVVTVAPVAAATPSATVYQSYFTDGTVTGSPTSGVAPTNAVLMAAQTGPAGNATAIAFENAGLAAPGVSQQVLLRTNLTYIDGVTVVRFDFRALASPGKFWLRIRTLNVTVGGLINVDVTDDATPGASRIGASEPAWSDASVTELTGGWWRFEASVDMTGAADLIGSLQFNMAPNSGGTTVVNDTPGAYRVAIEGSDAGEGRILR